MFGFLLLNVHLFQKLLRVCLFGNARGDPCLVTGALWFGLVSEVFLVGLALGNFRMFLLAIPLLTFGNASGGHVGLVAGVLLLGLVRGVFLKLLACFRSSCGNFC